MCCWLHPSCTNRLHVHDFLFFFFPNRPWATTMEFLVTMDDSSSWRVRSDTIALQELLPREPAEPREPLRSPFGTASFSSSTDQLNPARAVGAGAQSEPCPCLPSSRGRKPSSASKTTTGEMDAAGRKLKILCFACGCGGGETTQRIRRKPPLQNQSIFSDKEDRVAS
jgi:hypothetical protein